MNVPIRIPATDGLELSDMEPPAPQLYGKVLVGAIVLLLLMITAALTASRRLKAIGNPVLLSFWAIFAGSGVVIAVVLATVALELDIAMLIPVVSMIIANAMNGCAQAVERFIRSLGDKTGMAA